MILALLLACGSHGPPEAVLPAAPAEHGPSYARFLGDPERLADTSNCAGCHADQHGEWSEGAHRHASLDNPWYLASFESVRQEVGTQASRHCAGCHDPVLLASGAIDGDVEPGEAHTDVGVTCLTCHGIRSVTADGNASYVLDVRDLPDPDQDLDAHRARMLPEVLSTGEACGSCHRGFLSEATGNAHHVPGLDESGIWATSAWSGSNSRRVEAGPPRKTCVDCHAGDHGMAAGRTSIVADHDALRDVVEVSVPAARVNGELIALSGPLEVPAGTPVSLWLTVRNTGVGHRFPGGLADLQDTWVDLELGDRAVRAVSLRALALDAEGRAERNHRAHRIAVKAFDHTIPPGEAQAARVDLVSDGTPIDPRVVVRHRPHRDELADAGCSVASTATLPCVQPATTEVAVGGVRSDPDALFALALGLSRGRVEDLGEAHDVLALHRPTDPADRARWEGLRARVLARESRLDDALAALARAEEANGPHAAIDRTRGDAYAVVWKWALAEQHYARVAQQTPGDPTIWRDLARAAGSAGHHDVSLSAARTGLALQPRDADLLRHQALALKALGSPLAEAALDAWDAHRKADEATAFRIACDARYAECDERAPVPAVEWPRG